MSAAGLVVAFALSLSGIASTRGAVRPETQAAVVAAAQRHSGATDADTATGPRRGHCRHGDRQRGGTAGVGRV